MKCIVITVLVEVEKSKARENRQVGKLIILTEVERFMKEKVGSSLICPVG